MLKYTLEKISKLEKLEMFCIIKAYLIFLDYFNIKITIKIYNYH